MPTYENGVQITYRGLVDYPVESTGIKERKESAFKASLAQTLRELAVELRHLGADGAFIELDVEFQHVRSDGGLRADARVTSPRVVLTVPKSAQGPLRYPADRFTTWEDNLRGIRLTLERLRDVDRYGATRRGEQYTGWKQLPGKTETVAPMSSDEAAHAIQASIGGRFTAAEILESAQLAKASVTLAIKATHPDRGGKASDFQIIQAARKVLSSHHGEDL